MFGAHAVGFVACFVAWRTGRDTGLDNAALAHTVERMRAGVRAEVQRIVMAILNVRRREPGARTTIFV